MTKTDVLIRNTAQATYITLPDEISRELENRIHSVLPAFESASVDIDGFELLSHAGRICHRVFPDEMKELCQAFGRAQGPDVLFIENLPQQEALPPTPCKTGYLRDEHEMLFGDFLHLGMLQLMELFPVAYEHENRGLLFRNVVPREGAAGEHSSHGSDVTFPFHVDNPDGYFWFENMHDRWIIPPVLSFRGYRNEDAYGRSVRTTVLTLAEVVSKLGEETLGVLQRPEFRINGVASNEGAHSVSGVPILMRHRVHGDHVRYDAAVMEGMTERADIALQDLNTVLRRAEGRLDLQVRGDAACFFHGTKTFHQRAAFPPGPSEVARWLRRCYATPDLHCGEFVDRRKRPFLWGRKSEPVNAQFWTPASVYQNKTGII